MLANNRVVQLDPLHMNSPKGGNPMSETPSKTYTFGNTKVIIHSKLVKMDSEGRKNWWKEAIENKSHPDHFTCQQIADAVNRCTPRSS